MADKCVNSNMVYRFYVTRSDNNTTEAYTGCTWNFKRRHDAHIRSMNSDSNSTTLSTHVKSIRRRNIQHNIRWQFKEHASPFNPGIWWCRLCTLEKYYILFEPEEASLNYLVTDLATSTDFLISNFSCIVFINFCILLYPYLFF